MKSQSTLVTLVSLIWLTSLYGDDRLLLSPEKQNYFQQQQQLIDASYEKTRYEWLSPITLKASSIYEKTASFGAKIPVRISLPGLHKISFDQGGLPIRSSMLIRKKRLMD